MSITTLSLKNYDATVIIPFYNNRELLLSNLPKVLHEKERKENHIREIILVDDGSSDGGYDMVKSEFPEIKLIKHTINRGFSAAINTGIRASKGSLVVLLNSDVVPEDEFLAKAVRHFKNPLVFAVSFYEEGFSWAKGMFKEGFVLHKEGPLLHNAHETFWVNGGSGVFRRDYFIKLGSLDEKLFSPFYWEDIDISYRAAKRGLVNMWEPKAKVRHLHALTIGKLPKRKVNIIIERNQLLFIWKNVTSPILFRKHIVGVFKRVLRHPGYIKIVFKALEKYKSVRKARQKEIKNAVVSDEAIFARFSE